MSYPTCGYIFDINDPTRFKTKLSSDSCITSIKFNPKQVLIKCGDKYLVYFHLCPIQANVFKKLFPHFIVFLTDM